MSLPKHPSSHSSSPSKSSLRSTSGTSTTQKLAPGRALLPSLHSEERLLAHSQTVEVEQEGEEESGLRERDGASFQPFFTLIEDSLTHTHHHPTVHYIFADDDTDIVTEAACRSLAQDDPFTTTTTTTTAPVQATGGKSQKPDQRPGNGDEEEEPSKLPAPQPGVREHYLILDVQPLQTSAERNNRTVTSSYEVTQAHSLSAEWQVTNTAISNAPTIDAVEDGGGGFEGSEGLMLRIEGRGIVPSDEDDGEHNNGRGSREQETLEERVRRFEMGLAEIRRAIEAGGGFVGRQEEVEVLGD